jgi:hypothetical protein
MVSSPPRVEQLNFTIWAEHSIHYATMDAFNENWIAATIEDFQMEVEEEEGKTGFVNF